MAELHSFCTLCRSQCGTINVVENGRLVAVKPDPSHPTGQAICPKGRAGPEIVAANNRILYPMRRTRPKSADDPGWQRISWDEALGICAERLATIRQESGPEAVAFGVTTKSGTSIADSIEWVDRFVRVFGSPNVAGAVDICNWHKDVAHRFTFGVGMPVADFSNAELILLWGHNPTSTWLAQSDAIARGRAKGASLMVVDPRETSLAQSADVWLQVRPGTDAALALGLSNLLIRQGKIDIDFVRSWTNAPILVSEADGRFLRERDFRSSGGDQFVAWDVGAGRPFIYDTTRALCTERSGNLALNGTYIVHSDNGRAIKCRPAFDHFSAACRAWTPDRVHEVTGVKEPALQAAAEILARHKRIAYHAWNGVGQSINATQTERAIATLYALRGCFDDIGCNRILATQPVAKVDALSLIPKEQLAKALGAAERPIGPPAEGRVKPVDVYRALATGIPYPIRAFVGFGTNHLLTQGDTEVIRKGLESAEFHVHCDMVETPTARYADIVLPVSTPWERESLRTGFEISEAASHLIQLRPAVVPPRGEARSDLDIVFDLAQRLGFGEQFFGGSVEAGWNHILAPLGITVQNLRENGGRIVRPLKHAVRKYSSTMPDGTVSGFQTETRRVELYSEMLLRNGQSPLPVHREPAVDRSRFPLTLTSMKNGYFCHSQHHGIASLRRRASVPTVSIHPKLAEDRKIVDGQWVEIISRYGKARFVAQIDNRVSEAVLAGEFGWWEDCEPLGKPPYPLYGSTASNFNALVSADERDPISGSVGHKSVACEIAPLSSNHSLTWRGFKPFFVAGLHRETEHTISISLAPVDGSSLPDYEPGQYIRLRTQPPQSDGHLVRAYSLTGPACLRERATLQICVGRSSGDKTPSLSQYLHDELKIGDLLEVEAPDGMFTIPRRSSVPIVLIATGMGITPFIGYLESLVGLKDVPRVTLLYGSRNKSDHAFARRLRELASELPSLTMWIFYSQPRASDIFGQDYHYARRLNAADVERNAIEKGARFYCCGSDEMVRWIKGGLIARGVPRFDIFSEVFVSPGPVRFSNRTCTVQFKRSGATLVWSQAEGTLLDCAEKLNIKAPSGCRVGQCESCAVRIISGKTEQISGAEPDDVDIVYTCQGVPLTDLVLDL